MTETSLVRKTQINLDPIYNTAHKTHWYPYGENTEPNLKRASFYHTALVCPSGEPATQPKNTLAGYYRSVHLWKDLPEGTGPWRQQASCHPPNPGPKTETGGAHKEGFVPYLHQSPPGRNE